MSRILGISKEKLKALLAEGFSEEYIAGIMRFVPSEEDETIDANESARNALGIYVGEVKSQVAMTARFSPVPPRGFNRGRKNKWNWFLDLIWTTIIEDNMLEDSPIEVTVGPSENEIALQKLTTELQRI